MIEVKHAVKSFGRKQVLAGISFNLMEGQIVGLLGTNGAGKSTLLKAMAGLIRLDQGTITFDGNTPMSRSTRSVVSYLPDHDAWHPWMTLTDAMQYLRDIYTDWNVEKAGRLLDFFELPSNTLMTQSSRGMRAKMKLLLALSRDARYLLLDEPFAGIDPFAREQIALAIAEDFLEEGQTIVITTHEVSEVERMLDEILFIHEGALLLQGNVETLRQERSQSLLGMLKEVYADARV